MAITKTVSGKESGKGSKWVEIGITNGSWGVIKSYGPAYLTVNEIGPHGHGYRVFVAQEEIPEGVDNAEAAMALAEMLFSTRIQDAAALNVIETVQKHGKGEYTADLRTSW